MIKARTPFKPKISISRANLNRSVPVRLLWLALLQLNPCIRISKTMPVLSLSDVSIQFSGPPILDTITLNIDANERVCVLGRNGSGKTTLLKTITGELVPNSGSVAFPNGGDPAILRQDIPPGTCKSVFEIVAQGYGDEGSVLSQTGDDAHAGNVVDEDRIWKMEQRIERVLQELELSPSLSFDDLSGGMKRRALLGQTLVNDPAILVLDEPTNHMDIESITWLENYLRKCEATVIFVTHDRTLIRNLSTRIVEIDLGKVRSFRCDYDTYLSRKSGLLDAELKNQHTFDKKLSKEEAWLRQGIKARRSRNEGRVKALKELRRQRANRRSRQGDAKLEAQAASQSGRKVVTAKNVEVAISGKTILKPFSLEIFRGDRIGIAGPNGSGKTTLIKALLGEIPVSSGAIERGTKLQVAYFDQLRDQLDENATVFDNLADGNETITIQGKSKHVISYLKDFLFTPEKARSSFKTLSGGERNRLQLAKLFSRPANLLVLDEPTNDLDLETLETLEEQISDFQGTLLIVSHDRAFLENTVTHLIAIDSSGNATEFSGGYNEWLSQSAQVPPSGPPTSRPKNKNWKQRQRRLLKAERIELESIPSRIEALDQRKEEIARQLSDPSNFRADPSFASSAKEELASIETETEAIFQRWEQLEEIDRACRAGE